MKKIQSVFVCAMVGGVASILSFGVARADNYQVSDCGNKEISSGYVASFDVPKPSSNGAENFCVTDLCDSSVTEYNCSGQEIASYCDNSNNCNWKPCDPPPCDPVPEPSTYALLTAGAAVLFFVSRRKAARA